MISGREDAIIGLNSSFSGTASTTTASATAGYDEPVKMDGAATQISLLRAPLELVPFDGVGNITCVKNTAGTYSLGMRYSPSARLWMKSLIAKGGSPKTCFFGTEMPTVYHSRCCRR